LFGADETRQIFQMRFIRLLRKGLAGVVGALFDEIDKVLVELSEQLGRDRLLESHHEPFSDIAIAVKVPVKTGNFLNRLVEIIGHFKKMEVVLRDQPEAEKMILHETEPRFPVGSSLRIDEDDGHDLGLARLDERHHLKE